MILNKKGSGELTLNGVGVCSVKSKDKKCASMVFIAYSAAEDNSAIGFVAMDFPKEGQYYSVTDILTAIARAENAQSVRYVDEKQRLKDIYVCREPSGVAYDVVERDYNADKYVDGFAEVCSDNVRLTVVKTDEKIKPLQKLTFNFRNVANESYDKSSYEYAITNAYNACLLGALFSGALFAMETREKRRVRIEVRASTSSNINFGVLYVERVLDSEGFVDHYMTEEFVYIDGESQARRRYSLRYSERRGHGYVADRI